MCIEQAPAIPPQIPPVATVDWVMEPEIPRPEGTFLQYPTRRCFMEDRVEARVLITGFTMTTAASVSFRVTFVANWQTQNLTFISNDGLAVSNAAGYRSTEQRSLAPYSGIGLSSEHDSAKKIIFEASGTGAQTTSIDTSIFLPAQGDSDVDAYYSFEATITEGGVTLVARSPNLHVIRWWADPDKNRGFKRTNATKIEPMADGQAVFARIASLCKSAGSRIQIASWTFWMDTFLTGIPGSGADSIRDVLLAAAARGVKVYVLLDGINGPFAEPLLNKDMVHQNIMVKISYHHHQVAGRQIGTYHEKYVIVDGKTAIVGGIDFQPDRFNNTKHDYKPDFKVFRAQAKARGLKRYIEPFFLWHDSAVLVEGSVVPHVENDFARRWNVAQPSGNNLSLPSNVPSLGDWNVQVVKTDHIVSSGSLAPPPIPQYGTLDAYKQAILQARHYIYIENQYLNCKQLADALENALKATPTLQLIAIIPFNTEEARYIRNRVFPSTFGFPNEKEQREIQMRISQHGLYNQAEFIKRVRNVADAGNRVGIYTLAAFRPGQPTLTLDPDVNNLDSEGFRVINSGPAAPEEIYPHSKIMIVDDTWAIIGSANTNGRGFRTDGEMNIVVHRRPEVTAFRKALWKEHLGVDLDTRRIRDFFKEWNKTALPSVASANLVPSGSLADKHAVKMGTPPAGQQYNGNFSWIINVDDEA